MKEILQKVFFTLYVGRYFKLYEMKRKYGNKKRQEDNTTKQESDWH